MNLENLKSIVDNHPVISHKFLKAFRSGSLSKEQIRQWLTQQFFFSISLPSCFAALYARIPNELWKEKRALIELLDVEAWGTPSANAHSNFFLELADFLDLDIKKLTEPQDFTQKYIQARLNVCSSKPVAEGLACIALANEYLNLHVYRAYREGVQKIPGLENCPTGYFDAHLQDEQSDFEVFAKLFGLVTEPEKVNGVEESLKELLHQRQFFFDKLLLFIKNSI